MLAGPALTGPQLLPTAFTSLTDPCLPSFWNTGYPAMAGLIAMTAVFFVVSIEMTFSTMNGGSMGGCHGGPGAGYQVLVPPASPPSPPSPRSFDRRHHHRQSQQQQRPQRRGSSASTASLARPLHRTRRSGSIGRQLSHIELGVGGVPHAEAVSSDDSDGGDSVDSDVTEGGATELRSLNASSRKRSGSDSSARGPRCPPVAGGVRLTEEQQQKKNLLQVLLLEAGILFHSVFIGGFPPSDLCSVVYASNRPTRRHGLVGCNGLQLYRPADRHRIPP